MAESKLVQWNYENNSYIVCTVYTIYAFSMLSPDHISDHFMHLLPGIRIWFYFSYLAMSFLH